MMCVSVCVSRYLLEGEERVLWERVKCSGCIAFQGNKEKVLWWEKKEKEKREDEVGENEVEGRGEEEDGVLRMKRREKE